MQTLIRLNGWLADLLVVETHLIKNIAPGHPANGGFLKIEASDVGSSYGILPDLIVADELTNWEGEGELWHSLLSSAAKRSSCLLFVITNAGITDSWQWQAREAVRTEENWHFNSVEGVRASWMTEKRLAEMRRLLPRIAYERLYMNRWATGGGDALTPEDISAAFRDDLEQMTGKERDRIFVCGVDLSISRDNSAVVVLAVPKGGGAGKIRLAHHRLYRPVKGKIDLMEIERHILWLDEKYRLEYVTFDPHQAVLMAQRLESLSDAHKRRRNKFSQAADGKQKPWMQQTPQTSANLQAIASLTIECFQDHRLELFPCPDLESDLRRLRVEERPNGGWRLVSPRDAATGHGDSASAFCFALQVAHELAGKKPIFIGATVLDHDSRRVIGGLSKQLKSWESRQESYRREMEELSTAPSDDTAELFSKLMMRG
jgi:hypothetical protein